MHTTTLAAAEPARTPSSALAVGLTVALALGCGGPAPEASTSQQRVLRGGGSATAPVERDPALESALAAAEKDTGGTLGVAALHIPSGRTVRHRADQRFPMASTYKVPIALAVLARVDAGEVSLDQQVTLTPADYRLGASTLDKELPPGGGPVTVRRLLETMMISSDNTATDAVMRLIGGPEAVNAHLRSRGIDGVRVDRYEGQVFLDYHGVREPPPASEWTVARLQRLVAAVPQAEKQAARTRFFADERDSATPDGMAALLAQVQRGEGLSAASRTLLLEAMRRSTTGLQRIRAGVPRDVTVADKTGTIGRTTNDVGLITLPDGTSLALAVFVKDSPRANTDVEPAIAAAARAVYTHFTRPAGGQ